MAPPVKRAGEGDPSAPSDLVVTLPFGWSLGGGNASTIAFFDWEKEKVSGTYQACFVSIERVDYFDTCECEIFCIPSGYGKLVLSGGGGDEAIFHRHSTALPLQVC